MRRTMRRVAAIVVGVGLALLLPSDAFASTTSTTASADCRSALASRLAKEYRGSALADDIVAGISADVAAGIEGRVTGVLVISAPPDAAGS